MARRMQNAKCSMQNAKVRMFCRFALTVFHFAFCIIFLHPLQLRASVVNTELNFESFLSGSVF